MPTVERVGKCEGYNKEEQQGTNKYTQTSVSVDSRWDFCKINLSVC